MKPMRRAIGSGIPIGRRKPLVDVHGLDTYTGSLLMLVTMLLFVRLCLAVHYAR
jgi:hypothetical protein